MGEVSGGSRVGDFQGQRLGHQMQNFKTTVRTFMNCE